MQCDCFKIYFSFMFLATLNYIVHELGLPFLIYGTWNKYSKWFYSGSKPKFYLIFRFSLKNISCLAVLELSMFVFLSSLGKKSTYCLLVADMHRYFFAMIYSMNTDKNSMSLMGRTIWRKHLMTILFRVLTNINLSQD